MKIYTAGLAATYYSHSIYGEDIGPLLYLGLNSLGTGYLNKQLLVADLLAKVTSLFLIQG